MADSPIKTVRPGDPISADGVSGYNRLVRRANQTLAGGNNLATVNAGGRQHVDAHSRLRMGLVELAEDVDGQQIDKDGELIRRLGTSWLNSVDDSQLDDERIVDQVGAPRARGIYLEGEWRICYYDTNHQVWLPIEQPGILWGKPDSDLTNGSQGTVRIWSNASNGTPADTGLDATSVMNRLFTKIWSDIWVALAWDNQSGYWHIIAAQPTTTWLGEVETTFGIGATNISVINMVAMDGFGGPGSATVTNEFGMGGNAGDKIEVRWREVQSQGFYASQIRCLEG